MTVATKGRDFYGKNLDEGHVIAWSKDKYHLFANEAKESHVAACAIACMEAMEDCAGKEKFIEKMAQKGWKVTWKDSRKNITFENEEGKKVRDSNISKTFHMNITKEALTDEFERQNQIRSNRESEEELEQYYRDIIATVGGMAQAVQTVTMERDNLLKQLSQSQKLFREQRKEWERRYRRRTSRWNCFRRETID